MLQHTHTQLLHLLIVQGGHPVGQGLLLQLQNQPEHVGPSLRPILLPTSRRGKKEEREDGSNCRLQEEEELKEESCEGHQDTSYNRGDGRCSMDANVHLSSFVPAGWNCWTTKPAQFRASAGSPARSAPSETGPPETWGVGSRSATARNGERAPKKLGTPVVIFLTGSTWHCGSTCCADPHSCTPHQHPKGTPHHLPTTPPSNGHQGLTQPSKECVGEGRRRCTEHRWRVGRQKEW